MTDIRSRGAGTAEGVSAAGSALHQLPLLIVAQVAMHAAMAGQRMAAPLHALRLGHGALAVGLLLAVFAALPVAVALAAGRYADRHGYHRPIRLAAALTMGGALLACAACALPASWQFGMLCIGAALAGAGTNIGLITVQRTATVIAADASERLRVFSWLGMAPAIANVVGPVGAGLLIDAAGFAAAYAFLAALPVAAVAAARRVPKHAAGRGAADRKGLGSSFSLLASPGIKRLLFVNWLVSASWDVHSFAVPVLGHAHGFHASTIGVILGTFTAAITLIRFAIPLVAQRADPIGTLRAAMLLTAAVFAIYPFARSAAAMIGCAALLGLALGSVQPMLMSTLHHLTPDGRHGEAIALRSMAINASSSVMPLVFGSVGAALGPAVLFWIVGAAVGLGSQSAIGLRRVIGPQDDRRG